MKNRWLPILLGLALLAPGFCFAKKNYKDMESKIPYQELDELRVTIELSMAELTLGQTQGNNLLEAKIHYQERRDEPTIHFEQKGKIGYLTIKSGEKEDDDDKGISIKVGRMSIAGSRDEETWELLFSPKVRTSFEISLGLVDGELDLTDLRVYDLSIESGLADLELTFDRPNTEIIENMKFEVGLGDLKANKLGNANFKMLRVETGLGSADLDFSGKWQVKDAEMKIEVGLGSAEITIPETIGVEVQAEEGFLSSVDLDRDIKKIRKGLHRSKNWESAGQRFVIDAEVGLGSLDINISE
ncbi:MAG: toast rack family protein [bacterium]